MSNSAKLDYQMGYLVVRRAEIVKVHISEIYMLIIESTAVSLTAALLCELTKKKIKVIFCDEKGIRPQNCCHTTGVMTLVLKSVIR